MARRPDTSEIRRNQILDAATTVFVRQGFQHARMDDIVEESGLSKGTLYWYFKSKEDIINAILRRLFTGDLENLESLVQAEGTSSERMIQLTNNRVNFTLVDGSSNGTVGDIERELDSNATGWVESKTITSSPKFECPIFTALCRPICDETFTKKLL